MTKRLITIIALLAIGCLFMSSSNAQIPYTQLTTLSRVTEIGASILSTGRTIWHVVPTLNSQSGSSVRRLYVYNISIDSNTTDNTITVYDANSYSDATLNNRVLCQYSYSSSTSTIRGFGAKALGFQNQAETGQAGNGGWGWSILGDVGYTFNFTSPDGKPLWIERGIHVDGVRDGARFYTIHVNYRKE